MLNDREQRKAADLAARHIKNPVLRSSVERVSQDELTFINEIGLLDSAIDFTNSLIKEQLAGRPDPELKNISELSKIKTELPEAFSWEDRDQRAQWSKSLVETIDIINSEIDKGYHKNPKNIDGGNSKDIFRFYLMDTYARWFATNFGTDRNLENDRNLSSLVGKALCEAVISAADYNPGMQELTAWMVDYQWIREGTDFDQKLVERAKRVTGEYKQQGLPIS